MAGSRDDDRVGGQGGDDVDAEFERLMSGAGLDMEGFEEAVSDAPEDAEAPDEDGSEAGDQEPERPLDPDDFGIEALTVASTPHLAVVITPVTSDAALAGVLRLAGTQTVEGRKLELPSDARSVPTDSGALVIAQVMPQGADDLALFVSSALGRNPVVLFARDDRTMIARRYIGGAVFEEVPPALILGACPDVVEELMVGATAAEDLTGTIEIAALTKMQAVKLIATRRRGDA